MCAYAAVAFGRAWPAETVANGKKKCCSKREASHMVQCQCVWGTSHEDVLRLRE
eukprot:CAMPEP_0174759220 /NCGR_PEP_ID=MMETSP1094-20130205/108159_1 /TAXON_ID=156173 /ORGANISM="Chrysochromulina brevifilum, Strain UTEX LB 985" /LENGTH=53 /DNA_ID=CAMNT_0015965153 /DNA_START=602 /DNA_END=763 /DNA_ORIENTATION=+